MEHRYIRNVLIGASMIAVSASCAGDISVSASSSELPSCTVITFDPGDGTPVSYSEGPITVTSQYPGDRHVHLEQGDNLYNHSGCCSTPYVFTSRDGQPFTVTSAHLNVSGAHYLRTSGAGVFLSSFNGTYAFGNVLENITSFEWQVDSGSGYMDDLRVCTGGLSPDAGAPDAGAPDAGAPDAGAPDAGAPSVLPAPVVGYLHNPFGNGAGCTAIRDYNAHLNTPQQLATEAGVDYQVPGDGPQDPLTRDPANMVRRVIRAVAPGRLIHIRRPTGQPWTKTFLDPNLYPTPNPAVQAGEDNVILIDVLAQDPATGEALLIQYTHVFPTVPLHNLPSLATQLAYGCQGGTPDQCIGWARDANGAFGRAYVALPSTKQSINLNGPSVVAGDELGYYAVIGRSTLAQGPHLHISMFHLPAGSQQPLNAFLQQPSTVGVQLDPGLYIPCP